MRAQYQEGGGNDSTVPGGGNDSTCQISRREGGNESTCHITNRGDETHATLPGGEGQ